MLKLGELHKMPGQRVTQIQRKVDKMYRIDSLASIKNKLYIKIISSFVNLNLVYVSALANCVNSTR